MDVFEGGSSTWSNPPPHRFWLSEWNLDGSAFLLANMFAPLEWTRFRVGTRRHATRREGFEQYIGAVLARQAHQHGLI
jgi:hypothetical protein